MGDRNEIIPQVPKPTEQTMDVSWLCKAPSQEAPEPRESSSPEGKHGRGRTGNGTGPGTGQGWNAGNPRTLSESPPEPLLSCATDGFGTSSEHQHGRENTTHREMMNQISPVSLSPSATNHRGGFPFAVIQFKMYLPLIILPSSGSCVPVSPGLQCCH